MSGDVQPRKRKDKKRRKDEGEQIPTQIHTPLSTSPANDDLNIHVHKEGGTGGGICAKLVFFVLLSAIAVLIGMIITEYRGQTDVDTVDTESRFSQIFEGWTDARPDHHDEHDIEDTLEDQDLDHDEDDVDNNSEAEDDEEEEHEPSQEDEEEEDEANDENEVSEEDDVDNEEDLDEDEEQDDRALEESEENQLDQDDDDDIQDSEEDEHETYEESDEKENDELETDDNEQDHDDDEQELQNIDSEEAEDEPADEDDEESSEKKSKEQDDIDDDKEDEADEDDEKVQVPVVSKKIDIKDVKEDEIPPDEKQQESSGMAVKLGVGVALLVVAHLVLVRKWRTAPDDKPSKEEPKEPTPDLSRRNTIVVPPTYQEVEQDIEQDEEDYSDEEVSEEESQEEPKSAKTKYQELRSTYTRSLTPEGEIDFHKPSYEDEYEENIEGEEDEEVSEEEEEEDDEEGDSGSEEYDDDEDEELLKRLEAKYGKLRGDKNKDAVRQEDVEDSDSDRESDDATGYKYSNVTSKEDHKIKDEIDKAQKSVQND